MSKGDAALRAERDSITVGNDLSVLKPYTPSWIDQADWEDMIDRIWNKPEWKKKSNVARQNRLTEVDGEVSKHTAGSITVFQHMFKMEKQKKRPVTLLEGYHHTHTSTNVSSEASESRMDEASGGRTREYITASSKRVADAVEAAMVEKHGPVTSDHPPDDFDTWAEATGGKKKGKLVGLGTGGDPRVMVTRTSATSSSNSSFAHHTGSTSREQVQTLEETIRRLQEDNTQMRAQFERDMQIEVQRQVEHQVLAHMQQRELEANAREQDREREWQQRMNDINSMFKKFTDSRPPP